MAIAGALVLMLGTGFVVVSLVVLIWRLHYRLLLRRLRSAPRLTCDALLTGRRLPRSVLVTGRTAAGPAGLLRSPAFDIPCVWFHTDVVPITEGSVPPEELRAQAHPVLRRSAGGPIGVTDQTGTVALDLKLVPRGSSTVGIVAHRSEGAQLSRTRPAVAGSGMARLEQAGLLPGRAYGRLLSTPLDLREEFIEPGQKLTVLARPRRAGGAILLSRSGAASVDPPDAWIATLQDEIASDHVLLRLFPIGVLVAALGVALLLSGV